MRRHEGCWASLGQGMRWGWCCKSAGWAWLGHNGYRPVQGCNWLHPPGAL